MVSQGCSTTVDVVSVLGLLIIGSDVAKVCLNNLLSSLPDLIHTSSASSRPLHRRDPVSPSPHHPLCRSAPPHPGPPLHPCGSTPSRSSPTRCHLGSAPPCPLHLSTSADMLHPLSLQPPTDPVPTDFSAPGIGMSTSSSPRNRHRVASTSGDNYTLILWSLGVPLLHSVFPTPIDALHDPPYGCMRPCRLYGPS